MANRATPAIKQETLSPPWLLASFDSNWNSPITALNDASMGYVNGVPIDSGSANNVILACPFGAPSAYNQGMTIVFYPALSNTGSSTITVSPLTSKTIVNQFGAPLSANDLVGTSIQSGTMNATALVTGLTSTSGLVPGQLVSGANITAGTSVSAIASSTSVLLNQNASGSGTNSLTFAPIMAAMIFDGTNFRLISALGSNLPNNSLNVYQIGLVSTQTFNCAGYSRIFLFLAWSSGSVQLQLNNVQYGADLKLFISNQTGFNANHVLNITDPSANPYTLVSAYLSGQANGAASTNLLTGVTINNGLTMSFNGFTVPTLTAFFSR